MKIRILPLTIFTCCLFLGGKSLDLAGISHAQASEEKPAEKSHDKKDAHAADDADEKVKIVDDQKTSSVAKDEPEHGEKETADADKKEEKSGHGEEDKEDDKGGHGKKDKDAKPELPENVSYQRPQEQIPQFTDTEKQVLQKLSDRRAELDTYARDLDLKASLLDASSKKLDTKLEELKKLKSDTEALLVTYNEHENTKIKSLVKIYESMKPSAAAGIFEEMDMDTLLEIIDKMSEKKASLILASMSPAKAKEITRKLADEKTLKRPQNNSTSAVKTAPTAAAAPLPSQPATPQVAAQVAPQPPTSITPPPEGTVKAVAEEKYAASTTAKATAPETKAAEEAKPEAEKPAESAEKKSEAKTSH